MGVFFFEPKVGASDLEKEAWRSDSFKGGVCNKEASLKFVEKNCWRLERAE
jgi:hypothetical protein